MTATNPSASYPQPGNHPPGRLSPGMLVTEGSEQAYVVLALEGDAPGSRVRARQVDGSRVVEGIVAPSESQLAQGAEGGQTFFAPLALDAVKDLAATGLVCAQAALRDFGVEVQWPPLGGRGARLRKKEEELIHGGGGWLLCEGPAGSQSLHTVGLHALGLPEKWLSRFPYTVALAFCREAISAWEAKRAIARAMGFTLGDFTEAFPMVRTGGIRPAYVVPLDDHLVKEHAPMAYLRSKGYARLAQIVEPDLDARFAWEAGCSTKHLQQVLCAEPVGFRPFAEIDGNWVIKP